jgi:hypothetical protein
MDNDRNLQVSDWQTNEVRRWKIGETSEIIVTGRNGRKVHLNQLYTPTYLFVHDDHSAYVSNSRNHRVMKWILN